MILVFHDDAGAITHTGRLSAKRVAELDPNRKWLVVDRVCHDLSKSHRGWDMTHRVEGGRLVPIHPDIHAILDGREALAEQIRGRQGRIAEVDAISPARWASLAPTDQNACIAYRAALCDVDPSQPKWPERPAILGESPWR